MELRIHHELQLLQTLSLMNLRSVCNSRPVRTLNRIQNIYYHQILADSLNEAATAPCVKAHKVFLISEMHV